MGGSQVPGAGRGPFLSYPIGREDLGIPTGFSLPLVMILTFPCGFPQVYQGILSYSHRIPIL